MRFLAAVTFVMSFLIIYRTLRDFFAFGWNLTLLALIIVGVINIVQSIQVFRKKTAFLILAFSANLLCLLLIFYTYYDLFQFFSPLRTAEIPYLFANLTVAPCVWAHARSEKIKKPDLPKVFD